MGIHSSNKHKQSHGGGWMTLSLMWHAHPGHISAISEPNQENEESGKRLRAIVALSGTK